MVFDSERKISHKSIIFLNFYSSLKLILNYN